MKIYNSIFITKIYNILQITANPISEPKLQQMSGDPGLAVIKFDISQKT